MSDEYRIVGQVNGYDVYTRGVNEHRVDGIIGAWFTLPTADTLLENTYWTQYALHFDDGTTWMSIQWDSWGSTDVMGIEELPGIIASIGWHGGLPIMIELVCKTGTGASVEDLPNYVEPMYELLLATLNEEYSIHSNGLSLDYPHYPRS